MNITAANAMPDLDDYGLQPVVNRRRALLNTIDAVRSELAEIEEERLRQDLWQGVDPSSLRRDAETALEEANAVCAAREAASQQDFRIRALRGELDLD